MTGGDIDGLRIRRGGGSDEDAPLALLDEAAPVHVA
jgi:hypothetical protein